MVIGEEIDRVAQILHELSDFSKSGIPTIGSLDLNAFLSDLTKVLKTSRLLDPRIVLHLDLDPSLPPMDTDKNKMKQIVINLIQKCRRGHGTWREHFHHHQARDKSASSPGTTGWEVKPRSCTICHQR